MAIRKLSVCSKQDWLSIASAGVIRRRRIRGIWRRGSESNRRIKVLQTSPLPLGYRALFLSIVYREVKTTVSDLQLYRKHSAAVTKHHCWNAAVRGRSINSTTDLLKGTGHTGKHVIRIASHQAHRTHHQHQNHSQHDRILGDVLAFFVQPEPAKCIAHIQNPPSWRGSAPVPLHPV